MSDFLKGIPEVLFKYREWNDNKFHQALLLNQELYFASSDQFNDPFDCSLPYIVDKSELTPDKIFLKYLDRLKEIYPRKTDTELHELASNEQQKQRLADEKHLERISEKHIEWIKKNVGVVCLTENENNFLMWSHYTNSHTGYFVGFDKIELYNLCRGMLGPVDYKEKFPVHGLFQETSDFILNSLYVKSKVWEYEDEFRLTKAPFAREVIRFPKNAIKEIIFGCKMSHQIKQEILEVIERDYPNSNVFEMKLNSWEFKLDKHQIR